ncbi:MAG TPA: glycoside hydrolase family 32 protein [Propionibacteriaceae bacterium]
MPDPTFPRLHIRPEQGWLNDPNGVSLIDGVYHVFFQFNPDAPTHGSIHWGHVSSTDLLTWRPEPVALFPRAGSVDEVGCWSGCVVDDTGVPTAVYTAIPDHAWNGGVALATSDRSLTTWQQTDTFVVGTPEAAEIEEVRDPFVFTHEGHRYAIQGAGARHGRPQLLLYGCDDLANWTELGPFLTDEDPIAVQVAEANIWECPNLAFVNGHWVLLISLWRWRDEVHELAGVRYLIGDVVAAGVGLRFVTRSGGVVDAGPTFYAPQLLSTPDRTLLWGWAWELGRSDEQIHAAGWAGALTFPRELFVRDGELGSRPAAELVALRQGEVAWTPGDPFAEAAYEVVATGPVTLRLVDGDANDVVAETSGTPEAPARILVDGSMVEIYADGAVFTTRAYPTDTSGWVVDGADATVFRLGV